MRRLVQLYIYDLGGEYWDVEPDGAFGSPGWHRRFWSRRGRQLFVMRVRGRLAGFVLVSARPRFAGPDTRVIAEFFVLRKYRRRGVGSRAALDVLTRFPGRWELSELDWNVAAQKFWRSIIRRVAVDGFTEARRRDGDLVNVVQHFETSAAVRPARRGRRRA